MQKRNFGKTGLQTSLLGFGGFHLCEIPVAEAGYLLNRYLDAGGNYIETAAGYGDGESEMKIGQTVSKRRAEYVLATKTGDRKKEGAMASIERSLKNLQTDHLDLIIMHAVGKMEDIDTILGPGGAMEAAVKAREEGKVRFIGISNHGIGDYLIRALHEYPFDAVMTLINYYDRFNFPEVEETLLPLAHANGAAFILMKPVGDGLLWKSAEPAFRYAMTRDVSVVVAGTNNREMLEADIRFAEEFQPMSAAEEEELFASAPELGNYVCRQCNKCLPCPQGLNIPEIFKYEGYFDRQMFDGVITNAAEYALKERLKHWFDNTAEAKKRYMALDVRADKCNACGECTPRCPYKIDIARKMSIVDYKFGGKKVY